MCKALIITIFTTIAMTIAEANVVLKEWVFDSEKELSEFQLYNSSGNTASRKISNHVKTPDGESTLELTVDQRAATSTVWSKQANFCYDFPLEKNMRYQIQFWCKGTAEGSILLSASQHGKPYTVLGKGGRKTITVSGKWQHVTLDFISADNWNCRKVVPRVAFGQYPTGGKIFFGPIRFSLAETFVPLTLNPEWQVFTAVKDSITPASFQHIPASLPGVSGSVNSTTVKPVNDLIDLAKLANGPNEKSAAILFNEFDSPESGIMQIGTSADWWMEIAVNGKTIFNTYRLGNQSHRFRPEDHVFNFRVKKGKNLIVAKILSGSAGWKWVVGKVPFQKSSFKSLIKIQENKDWKPVNMAKLIPKAGTALDLSKLNGERKPAGAFGRVIVNPEGKLAFEKNPTKAQRFYSFNFLIGHWRLKAHTWTKKDIEEVASNIATQGYNMVRFHGLDRYLLGWKVHKRPHKTFATAGIPQRPEDIEFDAANYDRFDYLFACLKKKGIYVNIDLMMHETGYTMAYPYSRNFRKEKGFKTQLLFNHKYREHWKAAVKHLLNHRNPYTATCLKDDPALVIVEPVNEQDFRLGNKPLIKELTPYFRTYLENKYHTNQALHKAWNDTDISFATVPDINEKMLRMGDCRADDAGQFLIQTMTNMTTWYFDILQENEYHGLVTQWDMVMRTMEIPVRALMPVIAQHTYFAHPNKVPTKNLVKKSRKWAWCGYGGMKSDMLVGQESSLNSTYFRSAAGARFLDRPFMITEYSHSAFNRYRHERGLYFGSYAALQGWDSLTAHYHVFASKYTTYEPFSIFENAIDPISRASEVVAALTWFRGDVKESSNSIQFNLSGKTMFPKHFLAAIGDNYAKLAMLTKIGIAYPEVKPLMPVGKAKPDLELNLLEFSPLKVTTWYASASTDDGKMFSTLLDKVREHHLLPVTNKTDYSKRLFQSDTGEITLNGKNETMTVVTPRLEGAVIKKNYPVILDRLKISSCSKPASVTLASLDGSKAISESKRLLLVFATNALNSGMTFENPSLLIEVGELPILMETAQLSLELKSDQPSKPVVYALNLDGTRAESLPCEIKNSKLAINLDTSTLKYATPFFEIIY